MPCSSPQHVIIKNQHAPPLRSIDRIRTVPSDARVRLEKLNDRIDRFGRELDAFEYRISVKIIGRRIRLGREVDKVRRLYGEDDRAFGKWRRQRPGLENVSAQSVSNLMHVARHWEGLDVATRKQCLGIGWSELVRRARAESSPANRDGDSALDVHAAIRFVEPALGKMRVHHRRIIARGDYLYATNGVIAAAAPCDRFIDSAFDGDLPSPPPPDRTRWKFRTTHADDLKEGVVRPFGLPAEFARFMAKPPRWMVLDREHVWLVWPGGQWVCGQRSS